MPAAAASRLLHRLAITLVVLGAGTAAHAQIYASAGAGDSAAVVLSNFASDATPMLVVDAPPVPVVQVPAGTGAPRAAPGPLAPAGKPYAARKAPPDIAVMIGQIAHQVGLSPALIHAVIAQESNFDPNAVSPKGALGLMQLLPATATRFGARHPFDPRDNILAGALYLRWLAALFDDRPDLVLAAYNAGEQTVLRAGRQVPEYAETKAYVARILGRVSCRGLSSCSVVAGA